MFKGHKKVYVNKNRTNYNFDSINFKLLLKFFILFHFYFYKKEFNDLHKIYAFEYMYAYKK